MIDYNNLLAQMNIVCEFCDNEDEYDGSFDDCFEHFKEEGWKTYKNEYDAWIHKCPDCVKGPSAEEDFK